MIATAKPIMASSVAAPAARQRDRREPALRHDVIANGISGRTHPEAPVKAGQKAGMTGSGGYFTFVTECGLLVVRFLADVALWWVAVFAVWCLVVLGRRLLGLRAVLGRPAAAGARRTSTYWRASPASGSGSGKRA